MTDKKITITKQPMTVKALVDGEMREVKVEGTVTTTEYANGRRDVDILLPKLKATGKTKKE